jgi:hypothetical protein
MNKKHKKLQEMVVVDQLPSNKQKYIELCLKRAKANSDLTKRRHRRPKIGITFVPCGDSPAAYLVERVQKPLAAVIQSIR